MEVSRSLKHGAHAVATTSRLERWVVLRNELSVEPKNIDVYVMCQRTYPVVENAF